MTEFPPEVVEQFNGVGFDLEKLFSAGALGERMGIEVLYASPERVTATMPVEGNTQPYGLLHGGATAALAETLGSVAAMLHGGPEQIAVGVDLNVTHHRGVRSGTITGEATPLHRGRSTASYQIVVTDEEGRRVCTGRLTCMIRPARRRLGTPGGAESESVCSLARRKGAPIPGLYRSALTTQRAGERAGSQPGQSS